MRNELHQLDGAKLVRVSEIQELVYVWHGGRQIKVYNFELECVDVFSSSHWYEYEERYLETSAFLKEVEESMEESMSE